MFRSPPLYPFCLMFALLVTSCAAPSNVETPRTNIKQAGVAFGALEASVDSYILGQGDKISILVFDEPDLTLDATVSASGFINYSYLGNLQVANKTPLQLEQQIAELLRNGYLVNPSVNVSVSEFRPFFIGGEVRSPGSYPVQPGLTMDKAIALAGGLTDRASTRRMYIVKSGQPSSDKKKVSMSEPVGPGDTINIQEGFF